MDFGEAIASVFDKYATFIGRARRSEYWWWFLFETISNLATCWIPIIHTLVSLGLLLPSLAVGVRRLHDTDRIGWFILLPAVAFPIFLAGFAARVGAGSSGVGIIVIGCLIFVGLVIVNLVWFCTRGTIGTNRFGPDPIASAELLSV
jgi:uncharacterized membrane protein YhaH (DUF805 family)